MGSLGRVRLAALAIAIHASAVQAGTTTFSAGTPNNAGYIQVQPDDYGTYGVLIGNGNQDQYVPPGVSNSFPPTYLATAMLFVTTGGGTKGSILLSDNMFVDKLVENAPGIDGIVGPFTRTVTSVVLSPNVNQALSAFRISETTAGGGRVDVALDQRLTADEIAQTAVVDQTYTFTNNGIPSLDLVFHVVWDPDLGYNGTQPWDDIVGAGAGVCGVYAHDGDRRWSVALGNGPMSTVPLTYYYAGKEGVIPGAGGAPAFAPISAPTDQQWVWINQGIPPTWRNVVAGVGELVAGESDPAMNASGTYGDATLGTEYRFTLAPDAAQVVHVRRYYGTTVVPCFTSTRCGNMIMDPGEMCDGMDTPTCVGSTCRPSACGDTYTNTLANEACDSGGMDTAECNGLTCTLPVCGDGHANLAAGEVCDEAGDTVACNANCTATACGDGYLNIAAGEECDDTTDLCDPTTCRASFTLGGGCGGCGTGGSGSSGSLLFAAAVLAGTLSRSNKRRRRTSKRP